MISFRIHIFHIAFEENQACFLVFVFFLVFSHSVRNKSSEPNRVSAMNVNCLDNIFWHKSLFENDWGMLFGEKN